MILSCFMSKWFLLLLIAEIWDNYSRFFHKILLNIFLYLFFLFFDNILDRILYLKKPIFFIHFFAHKTTIESSIPFVLIYLTVEFKIHIFLRFCFIFSQCENNKYIGLSKVLHILYLVYFKRFWSLLCFNKLNFHLVWF